MVSEVLAWIAGAEIEEVVETVELAGAGGGVAALVGSPHSPRPQDSVPRLSMKLEWH